VAYTSGVIDIHTDGSTSSHGCSGAACIVSRRGSDRKFKFNAYLGQCGSDTAELAAGFLGFMILKKFFQSDSREKVCWSSDSQVLLDGFLKHSLQWELSDWNLSAGGEVKNIPLWKGLCKLADGALVCCQHVSIDSGDKGLMACDKASRWAAESGKKLLMEKGPGPQGRLSQTAPEHAWNLIDLEDVLLRLKNSAALSEVELIAKIEEQI
jgi:ribonuclease HI